jgi:MFS family permease
MAVPSAAKQAAPSAPRSSLRGHLSDVGAGLVIIRRDRLILLLELAATLGNALGAALFAVGLPIYALESFDDATALGLLIGGFGGGALVSALAFGVVGQRVSRYALFVAAQVVGVIPYWIMAFEPPLLLGIAAMVLAGLASGPFGPIIMTVFQARVPADVRGRFFGAAYAIDNATTPLAILLAGLLTEAFSLGAMQALIAFANLAVTLAVVTQPA